jgi:hypothetical protein
MEIFQLEPWLFTLKNLAVDTGRLAPRVIFDACYSYLDSVNMSIFRGGLECTLIQGYYPHMRGLVTYTLDSAWCDILGVTVPVVYAQKRGHNLVADGTGYEFNPALQ